MAVFLSGSQLCPDQALMSFPSVKIGPGRSSRSHTAEEYIILKEIEEAVRIYLELLDGLYLVTSMYIQITFYKNILSGVFNLAYKEEKSERFLHKRVPCY